MKTMHSHSLTDLHALRVHRFAALLASVITACGLATSGRASPAATASGPVDDAGGYAAAEDQGWPEGDTVRELLHIDAQAARAASGLPPRASDWLRQPDAPQAALRPAGHDAASHEGPDRIRVVAIYGVGKALRAHVSVNGTVLLYRAGRPAPMGGNAGDSNPYTLQAIDTPCVRLGRAGQSYTACLASEEPGHE